MKFFALLLCLSCLAADPPLPPISPLGKQHPYQTTVTVLTTQIVTTVYEVKFLRLIDLTTNGLETNFLMLRTNTVLVTQTNSPLRPE